MICNNLNSSCRRNLLFKKADADFDAFKNQNFSPAFQPLKDSLDDLNTISEKKKIDIKIKPKHQCFGDDVLEIIGKAKKELPILKHFQDSSRTLEIPIKDCTSKDAIIEAVGDFINTFDPNSPKNPENIEKNKKMSEYDQNYKLNAAIDKLKKVAGEKICLDLCALKNPDFSKVLQPLTEAMDDLNKISEEKGVNFDITPIHHFLSFDDGDELVISGIKDSNRPLDTILKVFEDFSKTNKVPIKDCTSKAIIDAANGVVRQLYPDTPKQS